MGFFNKNNTFLEGQEGGKFNPFMEEVLVPIKPKKYREKGLYGSFATVFHMVPMSKKTLADRGNF